MIKKFLILSGVFALALFLLVLFQNCSGITVGNPHNEESKEQTTSPPDQLGQEGQIALPIMVSLIFSSYKDQRETPNVVHLLFMCIDKASLEYSMESLETQLLRNDLKLTGKRQIVSRWSVEEADVSIEWDQARLRFNKEKCNSEFAVQIMNTHGEFATSETVEILLPVTLSVEQESFFNYEIDMQVLINKFSEVKNEAELKEHFEVVP